MYDNLFIAKKGTIKDKNNIKNIRKYVFNNFTSFLIIIFIFNILIIDKKILYLILLLLFNDDLFVFLKIGYEMEYSKNYSYIITYLIRIIIAIYILLLPIINFFYVLFTSYKYNYPAYKQYYEICVNPLLIPNFDCSLLSGIYAAKNDIELFIKMQNKYFWNDLFIKNNVNTPLIIGNIKNKKIILNHPMNNNKKYIIKPIVGGLGKNIMDFNDLTISNIDDNNYIIQEKIIQTKIKGHFRINTSFNKKYNEHQLLNIYLCLNDKNKIASNNHNGGKCNEVNIDNDNIRNMYNDDNIYKLSNIFSKNIIDNIIFDALNLHKDLPNHIISVGWDIMIEDNKYFFLEGNVPHSTVFKDDKYFYEKSLNINNLISANIF